MPSPIHTFLWITLTLTLTLTPTQAQVPSDQDRLALKVEALKRLKGVDLDTNPSLKTAVLGVLDATRGTPHYVELVKQFNLTGQEKGLVEIALQRPNDDVGVQAMRLALEQEGSAFVQEALTGTNTLTAINAATALGHAKTRQTPALLGPLIATTNSPLSLRKQAIIALSQTPEGAKAILERVARDQLAPDLRFTAATELNRARWPDIKTQAAALLPPPQGLNAQPLPPLPELLKLKGDIANGKKVFQSATASCSACHKAGAIGTDVGPNLSEIGGKLGKDALYEAIFEPSAGVSFGFEAWSIELASGEEAYGLIANETPAELAIKDTQGIITKYKKSDITDRTQMQLSLMPTGLQQAMSVQDLVDLIEFLASLK